MAIYTRTDGLLEPRSDKAVEWVKGQPPGQMVLINVLANQRSQLQNRYLYGWIYRHIYTFLNERGIFINGIPWTTNTVHAAFKELFLVKSVFAFEGREVKLYESTASMSKKRFNEYIDDQIRPFCDQTWDIIIPEPDRGFYAELLRDIGR